MTTTERRHFTRHYIEMVVAMFVGMFALGMPVGWLLRAFGTSTSQLSPAMMVFDMAVTMTVPMVALMRYRGHTWQPCLEMSASMFLPAFSLMALLGAGVITGTGLPMVIEHVAMLGLMLVAMLLRRDEYTAHAHSVPVTAS
jgi:hypothetical protein